MKKTILPKGFVLLIALLIIASINPLGSQGIIPIPTHGTSFTGNSRGYWFTAPCDFVITGLRAPTDYSTSAQSIQLVKFPSPVATWPSTSSTFTTLYYTTNLTDTCFVNVAIPIHTGDVIGVITVRNNGSGTGVTSYTTANSPISSTIGPYTVSLARFGCQHNILSAAGYDFFTEGSNPIGRAEIRFELPAFNIPIPPHASNFTSSMSRGYWFTAPVNFTITGVRAPLDVNTNPQAVHLVKFTTAPPTYSSTTTAFTTLYYGTQADTNYIQMNIPVNTGDIIGVLAVRNSGTGDAVSSYTSANSPITSSIGTHNITLARLGHQGNILNGAATNFWTEAGLPIGRAQIRIEQPAFYKFATGSTIANSIPFLESSSGSNKRQWIFYPSNFSCTPPGYITKIYLKASAVVNPNLSGLLIRMGQTSLSTFPNTNFVTNLDTVLYAPTISLHSIEGNWIPINLTKPFYYSGTSNFVVEASHLGASPGFYILQTTLTGRSIFGNSSGISGTIQDRLVHFGFEIMNTLDAELSMFVSLPNTICEGTHPVQVMLENNSPFVLTTATVNWEVSGAPKPSYNWTGSLQPQANTVLTLGNHMFAPSTTYNIAANVSSPNGLFDIINGNDTVKKTGIQGVANPIVVLGNDTAVRMGSSVTLSAGPGFSNYLWSTGATTQSIVVDSTGTGIGMKTVWVKVTDANSCEGTDTLRVTFVNDASIDELLRDVTVQIMPNPSNGAFELKLNYFPEGTYQAIIFSIDGSRVSERQMIIRNEELRETFTMPDLPEGIYFLRIEGEPGSVTKKLVIAQ